MARSRSGVVDTGGQVVVIQSVRSGPGFADLHPDAGLAVQVCFTAPSGDVWGRPTLLTSTPDRSASIALDTAKGLEDEP